MSTTTYTPVEINAVQGPRKIAIAKARPAVDGASRSGIWVAIFAITMSFAAFTSALFVREGSAGDWSHLVLPRILYANTLVLLLSSLTLHMASRQVKSRTFLEAHAVNAVTAWMAATFALGLMFIAGQYEAWRQLAAQGLFLATNPNSSFFYVFTGMHVLHLLGGIGALVYLIGQLAGSPTTFRRAAFGNTAIYWHFMGVLWVYLLMILRTRI
ncbi:MAG: cytochrome c oxidase subunit 3 [Acidobacteriota bacterium]|nr:cytochrome c oxidase subunit 3 [Acidobacteriota bacterium]